MLQVLDELRVAIKAQIEELGGNEPLVQIVENLYQKIPAVLDVPDANP